jgi:hypothetical protein
VIVQILVGGKSQHVGTAGSTRTVGEQAGTQFGDTWIGIGGSAILLAALVLAGGVSLDFGAPLKVVADDRINLTQYQRRVLLHNLLGTRARIECRDHGLKRDARVAYAKYAVNVAMKGYIEPPDRLHLAPLALKLNVSYQSREPREKRS